MTSTSKRGLSRDFALIAVGSMIGGLAAWFLPLICIFVVPLLGWIAGGGTTKHAFLYARPAAALGVGAIGMTTFLSTYTFGWWPTVPQWIAYVFGGMSVVYWALYAGMRWLHTASASFSDR